MANLLDRNDTRRAQRTAVWREHSATERAQHAAYERITRAAKQAAEQAMSRGLDVDGLEL